MRILSPPIADDLRRLHAQACNEFVIVCPWIKKDALLYLLGQDSAEAVHYRVLTLGDIRDYLTGASDIEAIEFLLQANAEVKLARNLHAKIYIADRTSAILSSANLTRPGLQNNLEIGVFVDNIEELADLVSVVEKWFQKGRYIDANWVSSMRLALALAGTESKRLEQVECRIREAGSDLRGPTVRLEIKSRTVPTVSRATCQETKWAKQVADWRYFESYPELLPQFIRFFQLALERLPIDMQDRTWFGVHSSRISLTVGNIWLAAIAIHPKRIDLLIDNDPHVPGWGFEWAKSTRRYTPLGWVIVKPWEEVEKLNEMTHIWEAYERACYKVRDSPISRLVIKKNLVNKRKVSDLL